MYAPICKWGDNQSISAAQKLILIDKVHISDGNDTLVCVFFKVKSRLLQPFKICRGFDVHFHLWNK